jgi:UDP-glucose 4-epimerase
LVRQVGAALGRPARLWPCPLGLLRLAGRLTGQRASIESLTGSLVADDREIRQRLGWRPRLDLPQALAKSLRRVP